MSKSVINFFKNTITNAAECCYKSPANFWQKAAILTISTHHLCHIAVIGFNKDTPKKEKAFLIPQEIMDGVISLATFAIFAQTFKQLGRKMVKKGIIKPFNKDSRVFSEEFATTTNLVGSLIAVNIASPLIRNSIGAKVQDKLYPQQKDTNKTYQNLKKSPVYKNFTTNLSI